MTTSSSSRPAVSGTSGILYNEVQADFSKFYREINEDDEAKFTAKLVSYWSRSG